MTVAYIVVILLALVPQLLFTVLYWKWIPAWTSNPYGTLAQLDSWSQILILLILLMFVSFGSGLTIESKRLIMAICISPFFILGVFRLTLLKKAVESAKSKEKESHDS